MRPDDPSNRRVGAPLIPERTILRPSGPASHSTATAAANVVRGQIDRIYEQPTHSQPAPQPEPEAEAANPYQRTHNTAHTVQADHWKHYHSAWQEYYQKYYERYYVSHMQQVQHNLKAQAGQPAQQPEIEDTASLTKDQALYELRANLTSKLRKNAEKVRSSRHFIPITAALCVMSVFLFLQYNRVIFANVEAYVSPGNINPANIIVDPVADIPVSADPKLIIPKINVDVPINFNATPDQASQLKAMENGVAWFGIPGADSKPGQIGNTVVSGHSSNDVIDSGSYKFIFARLDQLVAGDSVFINYEGKRYTYTITKKQVVKPSDVGALVYPTDKPVLTLITCTPLGTALNRLLVTAEQISPNPKDAPKASQTSGEQSTGAMPGNSPTFVQRLFGAQ